MQDSRTLDETLRQAQGHRSTRFARPRQDLHCMSQDVLTRHTPFMRQNMRVVSEPERGAGFETSAIS
ncbi:hypothetical protein RHOFW104T7_17175 [Rhodanobacter thiooxydans]|uniref:Uncharacterized protein n=1 Tax=Rhodanobacter thiooxydans TaxID=416169 RepID=A0A154QF93_9GAMM|nr:hypothetical protein UUA_01380 [Rhodanobacter thiooxydans LCS2]KZC22875.1 hypothetical protein RHOFW104T7_17175 [Rhodanobacter thiooxydans]